MQAMLDWTEVIIIMTSTLRLVIWPPVPHFRPTSGKITAVVKQLVGHETLRCRGSMGFRRWTLLTDTVGKSLAGRDEGRLQASIVQPPHHCVQRQVTPVNSMTGKKLVPELMGTHSDSGSQSITVTISWFTWVQETNTPRLWTIR
ncbi:hypothetical protein E2C01_026713 [Portunus trituberculatus]|uniref:Uncharacterized protein n=1 Tax=Portunus trituberculatus TaxID=210409 RepID=A0A5B7EIW9_PORTR|nr:hypothetical protein [Portunus trituberculatus]